MIEHDANSEPSPLAVALAGALLIAAAMGIGRFAYTPLLPGLQETLGWSMAEAGDVASANYLGYLLGAMFSALLVQRPERRIGLLLGMTASALSTLASAWISAYYLWLGLRFLSGFASALTMILGTAVVVEVFARHLRPQLISTHFAGLSLGIIGSVLIVEAARLFHLTVFAQWAVLGLAAMLMLGSAWSVLRRLPPMATRKVPSPRAEHGAASQTALRRLIVAYGLFGFGYVVTATFIVAIARGFDHAALLEPATWITVGLVGAPSLFAWQLVSRRLGVFAALRLAYLIEALGVLLAGIADSPLQLLLGAALLGGTFMAITAMGFIAARQVAGANQDKALAWMTVAFGVGQLLGPAVAGRMAESSTGFAAPSILAALLLLVGTGLIKDSA